MLFRRAPKNGHGIIADGDENNAFRFQGGAIFLQFN